MFVKYVHLIDYLAGGEQLAKGQNISSVNGAFTLTMQQDGKLGK